MYLGSLNEKQKTMFLDLGIHLASADGEFSDQEKLAIDSLCAEMGIPSRYETDISVDDALIYFVENANKAECNIVFVELLGIAMADDIFDKSEKSMIKKVAVAFKITESDISKISEAIRKLFDTYKVIGSFIAG